MKFLGILKLPGNIALTQFTTLVPTGTTQTVTWANGSSQAIDLGSATGNVTLTLTGPLAGARYKIKVVQGAVARNLIWPAAVKWSAGVAPVITVTASAIDLIELYYDGTNYLGTFAQAFA